MIAMVMAVSYTFLLHACSSMLSRLTFGSKSVMEGVKNLIISTRVCYDGCS